MRWFRVYSEIKDDPKMLELDDHQFRLWMSLLAFASESGERGVISGVRPKGLAASLRTDENRLADALNLFDDLDMIAYDETARTIAILHWNERQYDKPSDTAEATRERKQRSRARHADVTPSHATDKTRVDTDTESDTDQRETHVSPAANAVALPRAVPKPAERERDALWDAVAESVGKPLTRNEQSDFGKTIGQLREADATPDQIVGFRLWWFDEHGRDITITHRCYRDHWGRYMNAPPKPPPALTDLSPGAQAIIAGDLSHVYEAHERNERERASLPGQNAGLAGLPAGPRRNGAGVEPAQGYVPRRLASGED